MKKKFLSLALIAMSVVAFSSAAQTSTDKCENQTEKVCCKKDGKKGMRKQQKNPFEGMNLTDTQKAQLQQLAEKRQSERKEMMQTAKAEKQRNDSTRMEERKARKKAYLDDVKAIVGPDQYVVFLENFYINNNGNRGGKAMMSKGQRDGKHKFAHHKNDRKGDRQKDGKKGGDRRGGEKKMKSNS